MTCVVYIIKIPIWTHATLPIFIVINDFIPVFLLSQGVAMVCGFLVVIALGVAAFYAYKTRGKIWRYGKPNIYWDQPLVGGKASEGRDVEDWVRNDTVTIGAADY